MIIPQALVLSYPVTRRFQSPWFNYLVYAVLICAICILIPLNCKASTALFWVPLPFEYKLICYQYFYRRAHGLPGGICLQG